MSAHAEPTRIDATLSKRRGYEWKRSGWTADAYLLKEPGGAPSRWVYKRTKPTIREGLMPTPDPSMRTMFRDQTLWVVDSLRDAPSFRAFAHLLPTTRASGRFGILQERARGIPIGDLPADAQVRARGELERVKTAAMAALPGVEIDANDGNIFFHPDGRAASLFDPAGGWWARLLNDKVASKPGFDVDKKRGPFHVGNSIAWRVQGGDLKFGDAWVVANVDAKAAFVVKHGFLSAYRAVREGHPTYERLGPPLEDEREVQPGHFEQRYAHGTMTWDAERHTRVDFD